MTPREDLNSMVSTAADTVLEQATEMECLLPRIARTLFTTDPGERWSELPHGQLRICSILQAGPRTMSAISEEMGTSVSAVTQMADRLERSGLVERVGGVDDRRTKNLQLTADAADMMRSRREHRVKHAADALRTMCEADRAAVLSALRTLLEASIASRPDRRIEESDLLP
ncbi:MAG TPA: MarR family transcriptional regulator [Chthonomonadales bacterium]|nr:MarR family transcriptional regulator [Chthonomonadales bacterium]